MSAKRKARAAPERTAVELSQALIAAVEDAVGAWWKAACAYPVPMGLYYLPGGERLAIALECPEGWERATAQDVGPNWTRAQVTRFCFDTTRRVAFYRA